MKYVFFQFGYCHILRVSYLAFLNNFVKNPRSLLPVEEQKPGYYCTTQNVTTVLRQTKLCHPVEL